MASRREFLRSTAATLCFVGCGIAHHAHAQAPARRGPVAINGKRVRTVDTHAHCVVPQALALAGEERIAKVPTVTIRFPGLAEVATERIAAMDAAGVDVQALSINPVWYAWDRDIVGKMIEAQNETLASFCAAHPERFVAFASAALQFPDLAVAQIEKAVKRHGLRGVAVGGSVAGIDFANPKFHPIWAKCEELGILVFIHPQSTPQLAERFKGNGVLSNVIGNPLDTTLALSHLIFEGTLDK